MPNYDPDNSNPDAVVGDPEEAMEEWEYQGQKKVINSYIEQLDKFKKAALTVLE